MNKARKKTKPWDIVKCRINDMLRSNMNRFIPMMLFILFINLSYAQVSEYEYKAAFIERFTRFVEWPSEIENNNFNDTFKIAVLGKNPFNTSLNELFAELKIKGQSVEIIYTDKTNDVLDANLVFISSSENKRIKESLEIISKEPILIVSDSKGFCERGTHINMFEDGNYIRYEINDSAIVNSGLRVSSLLLASAKIVETND